MSEKRCESPSNATSAKRAVERLSGYFPRSAAADPKIFATGLAELLSGYPQWLLDAICNVRSGLPAHFSFMPTIAEIRQYCEKLLAEDRRHREVIERWTRPRLPPPIDRSSRPTYAELRAKYGSTWGIKTDPRPDPRKELADLCVQAGVSVDDIPDAKPRRDGSG